MLLSCMLVYYNQIIQTPTDNSTPFEKLHNTIKDSMFNERLFSLLLILIK